MNIALDLCMKRILKLPTYLTANLIIFNIKNVTWRKIKTLNRKLFGFTKHDFDVLAIKKSMQNFNCLRAFLDWPVHGWTHKTHKQCVDWILTDWGGGCGQSEYRIQHEACWLWQLATTLMLLTIAHCSNSNITFSKLSDWAVIRYTISLGFGSNAKCFMIQQITYQSHCSVDVR